MVGTASWGFFTKTSMQQWDILLEMVNFYAALKRMLPSMTSTQQIFISSSLWLLASRGYHAFFHTSPNNRVLSLLCTSFAMLCTAKQCYDDQHALPALSPEKKKTHLCISSSMATHLHPNFDAYIVYVYMYTYTYIYLYTHIHILHVFLYTHIISLETSSTCSITSYT